MDNEKITSAGTLTEAKETTSKHPKRSIILSNNTLVDLFWKDGIMKTF